MLKLFLSALSVMVLMVPEAGAHKILMSVYESGDVLEGELGFSNGDMSANHLIEVFDESGNKLGEAKTDGDGYFTYKPTQTIIHIFRANLGAGHVSEAIVTAAELPTIASGGETSAPTPQTKTARSTTPAPTTLPAMDQSAIAKMIRDELRPLRREITAYKEKNDLQSILGGIGYIIGIFGFGMYLAARRKLKETTS